MESDYRIWQAEIATVAVIKDYRRGPATYAQARDAIIRITVEQRWRTRHEIITRDDTSLDEGTYSARDDRRDDVGARGVSR